MKKDSKELGKLIACKLRAQFQAEGSDCPGVETLAAYVDRTLTRGECESLQPHLALCARCQEQVAELVRLSEAEGPARVPLLGPAPGRRIAWSRWAWAAPALVALVAAGLWYTGEFRFVLKQQEPTAVKTPLPAGPSAAPEELRYAQAPTSPAGPKEVAKVQPGKRVKEEGVSALTPSPPPPSVAHAGSYCPAQRAGAVGHDGSPGQTGG
jgi:hypothetical protein